MYAIKLNRTFKKPEFFRLTSAAFKKPEFFRLTSAAFTPGYPARRPSGKCKSAPGESEARGLVTIALALALLMLATRFHHFGTATHLPDASWAVFFLAGFYLGPAWAFFALLAEAASIDYVAIAWGGVSSFCVSPAYGLLVPAYGALWLAGRWYRRRHTFTWATLLPLGGSALAGAALCELFSGGGFYLLSGRFADPSLTELGLRFVRYFPPSLSAMAFYLGAAALVHVTLPLAARGGTATGSAKL